MKSSSLESKTIRPGLAAYNFYRSDRHPTSRAAPEPEPVAASRPRVKIRWVVLVIVLFLAVAGVTKLSNSPSSPSTAKKSGTPAVVSTQTTTNQCAKNLLDKLILIDISDRHLWACAGSKVAYQTPVITGIEQYDSTRTPVGTYHVYAKVTNTTLTGSDATGSWSDPVYYWMPFLDNQFGTYGFHDATWRNSKEFGTVDPYKKGADASHGCVELPLGASKWLYEWSPVGTTVTVQS
jgi:hypothetical protein